MRLKGFVQQADLVKQRSPKESSGHGSKSDGTRLVPFGRICLSGPAPAGAGSPRDRVERAVENRSVLCSQDLAGGEPCPVAFRSEEHTSELQSPYVISYAVFCL